jgi:hypothetical protein
MDILSILDENGSLVDDVAVSIEAAHLRTHQIPNWLSFRSLFSSSKFIADVFQSSGAQFLLFLDPSIRVALKPFDLLSNEGAPLSSDKKLLLEMVTSLCDFQFAYVIYTLTTDTNDISGLSVSGYNTFDDEAASSLLDSLPKTILLADLSLEQQSTPLSLHNLSLPGRTKFLSLPGFVELPLTNDLSTGSRFASSGGTTGAPSPHDEFDQRLNDSPLFQALFAGMDLLVQKAKSEGSASSGPLNTRTSAPEAFVPGYSSSHSSMESNRNSLFVGNGSLNQHSPSFGAPSRQRQSFGAPHSNVTGESQSPFSRRAAFPQHQSSGPSMSSHPQVSAGGQPQYAFVQQQFTEQQSERHAKILGSEAFFGEGMFRTLYGSEKVPNSVHALSVAQEIIHDTFRQPVNFRPGWIKAFLLCEWSSGASMYGESLRLYSLGTRKYTAFNSDEIFFHCRFIISTMGAALIGDIFATCVLKLFDDMYVYMINFPTLSWKWIEDSLVGCLNRVRRLSSVQHREDYTLHGALTYFWHIDSRDVDFFLLSNALSTRHPCSGCGLGPGKGPYVPNVGGGRLSPADKAAQIHDDGGYGGQLKNPDDLKVPPRRCNDDWTKRHTAAHSLCKVLAHPCYYWAHGKSDFPCPNEAANVACPHPHAWPGKMTSNHREVKGFITWVKRDKPL